MRHTHLLLLCLAAMLFLSVGYAALSAELTITGSVQVSGSSYDIYIENVTLDSGGGITVRNIAGTVLFTETIGVSGTATFTVKIVNDENSDKTYVFERVIDGKEIGIDGVYQGSDITHTYSEELKPMRTALAPGESVTFTLTINNSNGVQTSNYVLDFHFIEKQGIEDLPDGETTAPSTPEQPDPDQPDPDQPDPDQPDNEDELNFQGVVSVLTSDQSLCLNDTGGKSHVIPDAMEDIFKKRQPNQPCILHCEVKSISGGTMSSVTDKVNSGRTDQVEYILVGDPTLEEDPNNVTQLIAYMYYESHCANGNIGDEILVYRQVLTYGPNPKNNFKVEWYEDGTFEGRAKIAMLYGQAQNGGYKEKDRIKMIDPTTWKAGAPTTASEP